MNVYTNTSFVGFYPVGTAAVVVADTPTHATELLNERLTAMRLPATAIAEEMKLINTTFESVTILRDGDY